MNPKFWRGRHVLITGHTGFKGSWLCLWLTSLGATVHGYALSPPTDPSLFEVAKIGDLIASSEIADIRDSEALSAALRRTCPEIVFHLAAQPLVRYSYRAPLETYEVNVMGTLHLLEAVRQCDSVRAVVNVTSDKCYDNVEWVWGYRETDALGGKDIYSGSKGGAELVIKSYLHSFFQSSNSPVRLAVGRAGNVVGGGDWAKDRIVADVYRAWNVGKVVEIRSPAATRPWQHVLEQLSGYLNLGMSLAKNELLHGEAFNFGPRAEQAKTVVELLGDLSHRWGFATTKEAYSVVDNIPFKEAGLLKLNCDKALFHLGWEPTLNYLETVDLISEWYGAFYKKSEVVNLTNSQLEGYSKLAKARERKWAEQ